MMMLSEVELLVLQVVVEVAAEIVVVSEYSSRQLQYIRMGPQ